MTSAVAHQGISKFPSDMMPVQLTDITRKKSPIGNGNVVKIDGIAQAP